MAYQYDANSNLTQKTDARSDITSYSGPHGAKTFNRTLLAQAVESKTRGRGVRVELAIFFLVLFVTSASGQKAPDIEKEYGAPTQVYSVSEHIWMTPEYGIDGQICRARLYPKRISPKTNYLWKELPFNELKEVLDRLIPAAQRGFAKEFFGETELGSGMGWTTYPYENVSIIFLFAGRVDPEIIKRIESPTFSVEDLPVQRNQKPAYRDIPYSGDGIEIVTIKWTNRKCGN